MDNKAEEELAKRIGLEQKEIEWGLKGKARVMNGFKGWIDAKLSEPEEGKFIFIYHPEKGEIPLEIKVDCALKEKQNDALIFKWMAQLPSKHNENPTEEVFKIKGRFREKPKRLINFAMEVSDRVPFEFTQLKEALIMIDNEIAKYTLFEVIGEDPVEEMSEVEKDRALRLLKDERILPKILEVTDWRVVGEQDTRLMIYLVCATCKLEKRVNGQITGESSAGKTWVKQTVLDLFPPEAVQSFSRITGTALDHAVDIDWNNKILDVAEAEGIEQAIEIIKHYTDDSGSGSRLLIPEKDEDRSVHFKNQNKHRNTRVFNYYRKTH